MTMMFRDRAAAGEALAGAVVAAAGPGPDLVLGLPRGGVPVAAEVARAVGAPLDVLVVRKIGAPFQPEYALGAIATGGIAVFNAEVPVDLAGSEEVAAVIAGERRELARREQLYRAGRGPLAVEGRRVLVVDDGAATGATLLAAVRALRSLGAREIRVAVPVASTEAVRKLSLEADRVTCLDTPASFMAVGQFYERFAQTSDAEVRDLLAAATP